MDVPIWAVYLFLICLALVAGLFFWAVGFIYQLMREFEEQHDEY